MAVTATRPQPGLGFYNFMKKIPLGRSYVFRLYAICFVGTHIPLFVVTALILLETARPVSDQIYIIASLTAATLVGTGLTLVGLTQALRPIMSSADALRDYNETRTLPNLPMSRKDDAGELMATVNVVCDRLETELRRREHQAATDFLTKLNNRQGFFDKAVTILNEARQHQTETALVLFDIDYFKIVNDTYGHPVGDRVIANIAKLIADLAGPTHVCGRMGGEEFAVLMSNMSKSAALAWAENVRIGVEQLAFDEMNGRSVTVSGGISAVQASKEASLHAAIERSDHALYTSKEHGRNQVQLSQE